MRFAGPAVANRDHVLPPQHIFRPGQFQDQGLVQRRQRQEVEAVEAFDRRKLRLLDTTLDRLAFPVDQLEFGQPQQIANMIDAVAGALPRQLIVLAQEGRQLQRLQVMRQQDLWRAWRRVGHYVASVSRSR